MKWFLLVYLSTLALLPAKTIEVFVALCDNKTQGIVPVGAKIGNGDDAPNNLYWGCSDGMSRYFKKSKKWKLLSSTNPDKKYLIETLEFKHIGTGTLLTAHAYRGSEMKKCLEDYFAALQSGGPDKLVAFIGHNGLMDASPTLPEQTKTAKKQTPTIVLCCISDRYFAPHFQRYQANPLLLTSQLMYPGSFILHDAIEVWLKNGKPDDYLQAAAAAYAKNQKISAKAAKTIFSLGL
ncbi:hypothetical protein [Roseibacillus persicicus]|uniref:hypothetical protein n=1 Tax=Roseibacillus persicicus TaxID=454148 RepID=UPI00280FC764|nr:hypothetical protein [Roseibacillus persicicus]MDQ8189385.1 hypothetical protein [Roseibacillus persicicus]